MDKENASAATGSQAPGKQIPYSLKSTKKRSRQWLPQTPTPSRSSSEIDVSNEFTTPVKCKRTSKSPNKGKAKKAKTERGSYCLEQLLLCDCPFRSRC
ncbi:hypothetical protein TNCV_1159061 [Trichonephila clavipes]|nr:hypothetical protein TNCV_1159061 [Trichonephila clavipes]